VLTKTALETDLCVVGGGIAGVCAALAAARSGVRVVLVQDCVGANLPFAES